LDHEILVREILPGEESKVRDFFERNLGVIDRIFFPLAFRDALKSAREQLGTSLVAVYNGEIVGSVSLRIVVYSEKRIVYFKNELLLMIGKITSFQVN